MPCLLISTTLAVMEKAGILLFLTQMRGLGWISCRPWRNRTISKTLGGSWINFLGSVDIGFCFAATIHTPEPQYSRLVTSCDIHDG